MLIVLSPAKALDFTAGPDWAPLTLRRFNEDTAELAKVTRKLKVADLKRLMELSDDLARLNRERFQAFDPASEAGVQAVFAFNGDVYAGLQGRKLDPAGLAWAQDHLRILSGLYGLLRPADAIQPYRLEMGTRLKTPRGQSLYDFWGDRIAQALNADIEDHRERVLINCASGEYFGAVDRAALAMPVIGCRFLEEKDGESRIVSFYAKRARGLMARFAVDNRIERAADLRAFDVAGYRYVEGLSSPDEFTFQRPQPEAATAAKSRRLQAA